MRFVVNESVIDIWTTAHFAWGVFARAVKLPLWLTVALATAFEVVEVPLERVFPSVFPYRTTDTLDNAIGDVAAVTAGWVTLEAILMLSFDVE